MIKIKNQEEIEQKKESEKYETFLTFRIAYFTLFVITYSINIVILLVLFTVIPRLELPFLHWILFQYGILFYDIIILLAFLNIFVCFYELVRLISHLSTGIRENKQNIIQITSGNVWIRIVRKSYLVFLFILILILKILQIISSNYLRIFSSEFPDWGAGEYITFHNIFLPIIYIQFLILAISQHILTLTLNFKKKKVIIKAIIYPFTWIVILVILFFFNFNI